MELIVPPVASVTSGGTTTYYTTLKEAICNAPTGSTVTLLKDVTENQDLKNGSSATDGNVIDNKEITITSDGTGDNRKKVTGSRFDVRNGGQLTFTNIIVDGGHSSKQSYSGDDSWSHYLMSVTEGSTLTFDSGTLVQNYYVSSHTVIGTGRGRYYMDGSPASSTINIKAGSTLKNLGANYGVFRADYKSTINMSGGTITNCTSYANEGILAYVAQGSTFNMSGGEITGCAGGDNTPGVIFLHSGQQNGKNTFEMTGGKIQGKACSETAKKE